MTVDTVIERRNREISMTKRTSFRPSEELFLQANGGNARETACRPTPTSNLANHEFSASEKCESYHIRHTDGRFSRSGLSTNAGSGVRSVTVT